MLTTKHSCIFWDLAWTVEPLTSFLRENNMLNLIKHSEVDKISNKAVMLYIEFEVLLIYLLPLHRNNACASRPLLINLPFKLLRDY